MIKRVTKKHIKEFACIIEKYGYSYEELAQIAEKKGYVVFEDRYISAKANINKIISIPLTLDFFFI